MFEGLRHDRCSRLPGNEDGMTDDEAQARVRRMNYNVALPDDAGPSAAFRAIHKAAVREASRCAAEQQREPVCCDLVQPSPSAKEIAGAGSHVVRRCSQCATALVWRTPLWQPL